MILYSEFILNIHIKYELYSEKKSIQNFNKEFANKIIILERPVYRNYLESVVCYDNRKHFENWPESEIKKLRRCVKFTSNDENVFEN